MNGKDFRAAITLLWGAGPEAIETASRVLDINPRNVLRMAAGSRNIPPSVQEEISYLMRNALRHSQQPAFRAIRQALEQPVAD